MIKSLELENFKAFGKRTHIPLAPITLIFGENSSGKSAILQSLYLLKQTLESRDENAVLLPRADNGIVDLGSFNDFVFDHDLNRTLSIRLDVSVPNRAYEESRCPLDVSEVGMEFSFTRPSPQSEVFLDKMKLFSNEIENTALSIYENTEPLSGQVQRTEARRRLNCTYLTSSHKYWEKSFNFIKQNSELITGLLSEEIKSSKKTLDKEIEAGIDEDTVIYLQDYIKEKENALKFHNKDFAPDEFIDYMQRLYKGELSAIEFIHFLPRYPGMKSWENPFPDTVMVLPSSFSSMDSISPGTIAASL